MPGSHRPEPCWLRKEPLGAGQQVLPKPPAVERGGRSQRSFDSKKGDSSSCAGTKAWSLSPAPPGGCLAILCTYPERWYVGHLCHRKHLCHEEPASACAGLRGKGTGQANVRAWGPVGPRLWLSRLLPLPSLAGRSVGAHVSTQSHAHAQARLPLPPQIHAHVHSECLHTTACLGTILKKGPWVLMGHGPPPHWASGHAAPLALMPPLGRRNGCITLQREAVLRLLFRSGHVGDFPRGPRFRKQVQQNTTPTAFFQGKLRPSCMP